MILYVFIRFSKALEAHHFEYRQAEYLYSIFISNIMTVAFKLTSRGKKILSPSLVGFSLYLWGLKNHHKLLHLIGFMHLKGKQLVFVFFFIEFWMQK